ncbi:MAG: DUF1552 domain-containing protein [Gemmataceae bacterium]|nr:DUF1552 domain-containing protein [Gemmataceae bacterium]MDW8266860.1 DUF1552 domain-containing protein [Gemmataceae bacterium]
MPLARLDRRTFLRASGVAIALPLLDAMLPTSGAAGQVGPRRMVLIGRPLGLHGPFFFPEQTGRNYEPSRYLKILQEHRDHFTVFSGMSHRYPAGHFAEVALFTGVSPELVRGPSDIRNGISLDQEVAGHLVGETRFACLVLGGGDVSWNRRGVRVPAQTRATQVFRQLFVAGSPEEQARELRRIRDGQSILDGVRDQIQSLNSRLGAADRQRLDLYLSALREAEQRLQQDERWSRTPKPKVDYPAPTVDYSGTQLLQRSRQWYDIVHLALQTDSTRVISLWLGSQERPEIDGVTLAHHDASHHGQDPAKIEQLARIEEAELRVFNEFLTKLRSSVEGDATLLDRTAVLYATNLGNASSHDNNNLPIILAGGGFRHAGHVAYDRKNNTLMSNLYVRMLHQMGIEAKSFGASNGVISEI